VARLHEKGLARLRLTALAATSVFVFNTCLMVIHFFAVRSYRLSISPSCWGSCANKTDV
jgi:hypothetical protein